MRSMSAVSTGSPASLSMLCSMFGAFTTIPLGSMLGRSSDIFVTQPGRVLTTEAALLPRRSAATGRRSIDYIQEVTSVRCRGRAADWEPANDSVYRSMPMSEESVNAEFQLQSIP